MLEGKPIGWLGPTARRGVGMCAVPEERNGHAAVGDLTLALNGALTARRRMGFVSVGLIREGRARKYAEKVIGAIQRQGARRAIDGGFAVWRKPAEIRQSGREILQEPAVLAVSQPTWGVDAGAAAAIRQAIVDLAGRGCAVLVISQDLDELLELCDSLVVINLGRLSRVMKVGEVVDPGDRAVNGRRAWRSRSNGAFGGGAACGSGLRSGRNSARRCWF